MEKPKLCPLKYAAILAAQCRSEGTPREDFECMKETCMWFNEKTQQCKIAETK